MIDRSEVNIAERPRHDHASAGASRGGDRESEHGTNDSSFRKAFRIAWNRLNPSSRLLVILLALMCAAMPFLATWVNGRFKQAALDNAAIASAQYIEPLIGPTVHGLVGGTIGANEAQQRIVEIIKSTPLEQYLLDIKIWGKDGTVLASVDPARIGLRPPPSRELLNAQTGELTSDFDDQNDPSSADVREFGRPIFEVYAPIFDKDGKTVLAVVEFYKDATSLKADFERASLQSWTVMGALTLAIGTVLFGIMYRGSRVIGEQQIALDRTLVKQTALLAQNQDLKAGIAHARLMSAEISDKVVRRIGADLHDGPAQLLTLALLRLDELQAALRKAEGSGAGEKAGMAGLRSAVQDALEEIRDIAAGAALPELDALTPSEVVRLAVRNHEDRTITDVDLTVERLPDALPPLIKVCLFRVIQEGLTNAFRHADGAGQTVRAVGIAGGVEVTVRDRGPGFTPPPAGTPQKSLGLQGLRHRVESLGGRFTLSTSRGKGTRITATLPDTMQL